MKILSIHEDGYIATLTIKNPPANALSRLIFTEISQMLDQIEEENKMKVIIIKGEGKFFSAGADVKAFTDLQNASDYQSLAEEGQQLFNRIEQFSIPVIASIHGTALGGGLELAMACHIRIVTTDALLGLPEITLGIIPGYAGTQRLPQLVGTAKAYEMILTGMRIDGIEAHRLGLVNQVVAVESLKAETIKLANQISSKSRATINSIMGLIRYARPDQFAKGVEAEAIAFGKIFGTADAKEGVQAFFEKRKPDFKD